MQHTTTKEDAVYTLIMALIQEFIGKTEHLVSEAVLGGTLSKSR